MQQLPSVMPLSLVTVVCSCLLTMSVRTVLGNAAQKLLAEAGAELPGSLWEAGLADHTS